MNSTKQTIEKIFSEIENQNADVGSAGSKSMEQVVNILLNRKEEPQAQVVQMSQAPGAQYGFDMPELKRWKELNNQLYYVQTDHVIASDKRFIGKLDIFIKKVVRKLIRPIIYFIVKDQNDFNASVTSAINALYNNEITTEAFIGAHANTNANLSELRTEMENLKNELYAVKNENEALKSCVTNLEMQEETREKERQAELKKDIYSVIDYNKFEKYFRGTKEEIKNRQQQYIPYFAGKKKVLDLGCGRGEFLELLKENEINAIGVDAYKDFVEECLDKRLEAVHADARGYLESLEDETVDGIFAAQLVEHLSSYDLVEVCKQAYKKMKFGGTFVIETPNPTCLATYTNAFYIDPTHSKPVHPKMLEYILKEVGFTTVEIVYPDSSKVGYRLPLLNIAGVDNLCDINDSINLMSDLIFGSQDYAIIAKK